METQRAWSRRGCDLVWPCPLSAPSVEFPGQHWCPWSSSPARPGGPPAARWTDLYMPLAAASPPRTHVFGMFAAGQQPQAVSSTIERRPPTQKGPELANTLCTHHYEKRENREGGGNFRKIKCHGSGGTSCCGISNQPL